VHITQIYPFCYQCAENYRIRWKFDKVVAKTILQFWKRESKCSGNKGTATTTLKYTFGLISRISGLAYGFSRFNFFQFQLSLLRSFSVFLISGFYLSHNRLFLDFFYISHNTTSISISLILFLFKTFLVLFSLCARLKGQLTCHCSSANPISQDHLFV